MIGIWLLVVSLWPAWQMPKGTASNDLKLLACLASGIVGSSIAVVMLGRWRPGLFSFIWFLFEDLFRKFLDNDVALPFTKELQATLIYFSLRRCLPTEGAALPPASRCFLSSSSWPPFASLAQSRLLSSAGFRE